MRNSFAENRKLTEVLCQPLCLDDHIVQSTIEVSPPKWHLAHTSWFFERFVLPTRRSVYDFHFNSYYETVGPHIARERRGTLARPEIKEVYEYRADITSRVLDALDEGNLGETGLKRLELGIHHEQQHQELLLTDIKHIFFSHTDTPEYENGHWDSDFPNAKPSRKLIKAGDGLQLIGVPYARQAFAFDHEKPEHLVYIPEFQIEDGLVTQGEYLEFIFDGGYETPEFWLSDGWTCVKKNGWSAPLYWDLAHDEPRIFTLGGWTQFHPQQPVRHVSFYEADAYARWKGRRLPTEFEWEAAERKSRETGQDFNDGVLWEWTSSAFQPYPGFQPFRDAWGLELGEYNGKFMSSQMVLRGASLATPKGHFRPTYRNFLTPDARWQFSGIRLAG